MTESDWLAEQFHSQRTHLQGVAYRILGSLSEADDAVQGTWLRLSRSDPTVIGNLGGWLTTAVAREALDILKKRSRRREQPLEVRVPDPVVTPFDEKGPEGEAVIADSVGLALLVVLDTLTPAQRVAFVLHDVFSVPFEEIAPMLERTPEATRQLASRARRQVQQADSSTDTDPARQRKVVEAFFAAARQGDFASLVAVLDPQVVLRSDGGVGASRLVRGADAVASSALMFADPERSLQSVLVNGAAGVVVRTHEGFPVAIMCFNVSQGKIASIDALTDPTRIPTIELPPDSAD